MTPHDSTRCAVCGYVAIPPVCTKCATPLPTEGVGAVDAPSVQGGGLARGWSPIGVEGRLREQMERLRLGTDEEMFDALDLEAILLREHLLRQQVATLTADNERLRGERAIADNARLHAQLAALRATPAEGEAVAFVPMDSEGDKWWQNTRESEAQARASLTRQKDYDGFEFVMVPLYAAPVPSEVTEEQVRRVDAAITAHMNQHGPIATLALARAAALAAAEQGGG